VNFNSSRAASHSAGIDPSGDDIATNPPTMAQFVSRSPPHATVVQRNREEALAKRITDGQAVERAKGSGTSNCVDFLRHFQSGCKSYPRPINFRESNSVIQGWFTMSIPRRRTVRPDARHVRVSRRQSLSSVGGVGSLRRRRASSWEGRVLAALIAIAACVAIAFWWHRG